MASSGTNLLRKIITSAKAPLPIGPYSQAVKVGPTLYISGQIGLDVGTKDFVGPDVESQTKQALLNMQYILEEAEMTFANVIKTTMLMADMNDFAKANEIYASFFKEPFPARAAFQVAKLPKSAKVEIEAIAVDSTNN